MPFNYFNYIIIETYLSLSHIYFVYYTTHIHTQHRHKCAITQLLTQSNKFNSN